MVFVVDKAAPGKIFLTVISVSLASLLFHQYYTHIYRAIIMAATVGLLAKNVTR
jgi:hypothetical protein